MAYEELKAIENLFRKILPGVNTHGQNAKEDLRRYAELLRAGKPGGAGGPHGPPDPSSPTSKLIAGANVLARSNAEAGRDMLGNAVFQNAQPPAPPELTDKMRNAMFFGENPHLRPPTQPTQASIAAGGDPDAIAAWQRMAGTYPKPAPFATNAAGMAARRDQEGLDMLANYNTNMNANKTPTSFPGAALNATPEQMARLLQVQGIDPDALDAALARSIAGKAPEPDAVDPQQAVFDKNIAENYADAHKVGVDFFAEGKDLIAGNIAIKVEEMAENPYLSKYYGSNRAEEWLQGVIPGPGRDFKNNLAEVAGESLLDTLNQSFGGQISEGDILVARSAQAIINDIKSTPAAAREALSKILGVIEKNMARMAALRDGRGIEDVAGALGAETGGFKVVGLPNQGGR